MKNKKKLRLKDSVVILILKILIAFFSIVLVISLANIIIWKIQSDKTKNNIKDIDELVDVKDKKDNNKTEIIAQDNIPKDNPYWDYIKMNMIDVDLSKLKEKNRNTVGWIKVNGTNINYPFVQTKNNDYYLDHSFNNKKNNAGWVFLDYRNNINKLDRNTILYAHGRLDKTMFGSLKNILTSGWLKNSNNYVIKMSTEAENTLWQVFSVYHIPTTSDYLYTNFTSDGEFLEFATPLLKRSAFNFNTNISKSDRIITLSTCFNDNERVVLHAKLIKREKK